MKHPITLHNPFLRRTAAAMAAASLILLPLTGCGDPRSRKADSQEEASSAGLSHTMSTGSYLEEELPIPEGTSTVETLQTWKDGTVAAICGSFDGYSLNTSKDNGQTWEQTPLEEYLGLEKEQAGNILTFALGKDGQGFFGQFISQGDEVSMDCWYRTPEGEMTLLPLSQEMKDTFVTDAAFDENGHLYLSVLSGGILMVDPRNGQAVHRFEEGSTTDFMGISGDCLAVVTGGTLHYYDTKAQKPSEDFQALTQPIQDTTEELARNYSSSVPILFLEDEDGIFFLNKQGLFHYTFGGTVVEQLIDGTQNSMSAPSTGLTSLTRDLDGSFYLGTTNFTGSEPSGHIYRYSYTDEPPAAPTADLTIYALKENGFLSQAATLFRAQNPDVKITVQTGMTGKDGVTLTDALKTLNTEILAGKGPDILLDGLPCEAYAKKGLLLDLSPLFSETELLENIQNAYTDARGAIYSMPVTFGIPMVQGQAEDVERITDLASLAEVIQAHSPEYGAGEGYSDYNYFIPGSFAMTPESLLSLLIPMCQSAWITPEGALDEASIQEFLTQAGRIYQAEEDALQVLWERYPEFSNNVEPDNDPPSSLSYSSTQVFRRINLLTLGGLYSPSQLATLDTLEQLEDSSLSSKGWDTQIPRQFLPVNQIGVNAASPETEAALSFVRFLFSQEGQSVSREYGFPTLRSLYEDDSLWSMGKPGEVISSFSDFNRETEIQFDLDVRAAKETAIHRIQELGKSLTVPAASNTIVEEAVSKSGLLYLKGDLTLSQAASRITKDLGLYLAE